MMNFLLQRVTVAGHRSFSAVVSLSRTYITSVSKPLFLKTSSSSTTPGRVLSTSQKRWTRSKLAVDFDKPILHDVLIYSYRKDRFFRLMTIFGIGQFIFWIQLAHFSKTTMSKFVVATESLEEGKQPWWIKYTIGGNNHKDAIAYLSVIFGLLIFMFCTFYPQRTINRLSLMKGGKGARISVYSHFGRTKSFTVPLEDINAMQGRAQKSSNMTLKIRGHRMYYMLDKRDGVFHEPELFDYRVALQRW